jgi:hypothetical protein
MRIPARVLDRRLEGAALGGTSLRGATVGEYSPFSAVVDERTTLRVDERPDSDTRGQMVTVTVQVIGQLEAYLAPGSRIRLDDGRVLTVVTAAKHSHRDGPSSAEMWCVR